MKPMTVTAVIHPQTQDQKNILADFFDIAEGLELSENLLQTMKKELNYEPTPTYPNGKGDPLMDMKLIGNRPSNSLPTTVMENTETTATPTEVEVTKVEIKKPEVTQEVVDKFCKMGKMLGLSPETIAKVEEELKSKMGTEEESSEEDAKEVSEEPMEAPKKNLLSELLK